MRKRWIGRAEEADLQGKAGRTMGSAVEKGWTSRKRLAGFIALAALLTQWPLAKAQGGGSECTKVELTGEVSAGQDWRAKIGEDWVIRLVPIAASGKGYTGWDLVIHPVGDDAYPDAVLLATPPYGSLSEREIGTTFGLRAQDAIAWTPRQFHFLTTTQEMARARQLFRTVMGGGGTAADDAERKNKASVELMNLASAGAAGEFKVLDAKLNAGVADPPKFAEQWAMHLGKVPHTLMQGNGAATQLGELRWVRFSVELWLPQAWRIPAELHGAPAKCAQ